MAIKIDPEAFYTEAEVSPLINKSIPRLQTLRSTGGGPTFIKRGKSIFYAGSDLLDYLMGGRVENCTQSRSNGPGRVKMSK